MRQEGWRFFPRHILPPLLINTTIGLTLFSSYTASEHYLSQQIRGSVLVPFLAGSIAGAAQSILSAPLDNARLLLLRRQRLIRLYGRRPSKLPPHARELSKPFIGWYALLRDSVFVSPASPNATLPPLTRGNQRRREVMQRAGQWAKRGWSLWGLSLSKDSLAFGTFFSIFEFGRGVAMRVGLKWDGIDPEEREAELLRASDWRDGEISFADDFSNDQDNGSRTKRSAISRALQSFLILVAGGLAGWSFSLVTRPFERARGAVWEGRARWAELDGRARVAEDLASRTDQPGFWRKRKKGWVLRKRVKRVGRKRGVGRTFAMTQRRLEKETIRKERQHRRKLQSKSTLEEFVDASGPGTGEESVSSTLAILEVQPTQTRQPLPSAVKLIHLAAKRHGPLTFFFAPLPILQAKIAAAASSTRAASSKVNLRSSRKMMMSAGPTRISARARQTRDAALNRHGGGRWMLKTTTKVLTYLPPYSVGLLVYALFSGDLR